jgi:NACHT domain
MAFFASLAASTAVFLTIFLRHLRILGPVESLVGAIVVLPTLLLAYQACRLSIPNGPGGARALRAAAEDLAARLKLQWEQECRSVRSANDPYTLPMSWAAADPQLLDDWDAVTQLGLSGIGFPGRSAEGNWAVSPGDLAGTDSDLAQVLDKVPSRRLVILGGPGAGKTVLVMRLVLDLLAQRPSGQRSPEPVPVLVPLAGWNPGTQGLVEFLTARLAADYPQLAGPSPTGRAATLFEALFQASLITLVLDGLDEVTTDHCHTALDKIAREVVQGQRIVVTCRTDVYRKAINTDPRPTLNAGVVHLEPVSLTNAIRYLSANSRAGTQWESVLDTLRRPGSTPAVAAVLTSPLMISLARAIYSMGQDASHLVATDPMGLLDLATEEAVRAHLLSAFVTVAYHRPGTDDDAAQLQATRRGLEFLAGYLQDAKTLDFEWWRLSTRFCRFVGGTLLGVASAVVLGLAGWIGGGHHYGLIAGVCYAGSFGMAGFLSFAFGTRFPPTLAKFRGRGSLLSFGIWFFIGVLLTTCSAFAIGSPDALWGAPAVGLAFGAYAWVSTPSRASDLPAPEVSVANDRTGTIAYAVALSVGFGIIGGLIVGGSTGHTSGLNNWTWVCIGTVVLGAAGAAFAYKPYGRVGAALYGVAGATVGLLATLLKQPVHSVEAGIAFGVTFGGGIGMTTFASRSWGSFTICRLILAMRGDLPWSLMAFLKKAHRRNVLRQEGVVYKFRHQQLQGQLASERTGRGMLKRGIHCAGRTSSAGPRPVPLPDPGAAVVVAVRGAENGVDVERLGRAVVEEDAAVMVKFRDEHR